MEIELKLALPKERAARLGRHPLLTGVRARKAPLFSQYFDTSDFALTRRLVALRVRRVGYHWVLTLKAAAPAAGALSRRPEWEVQVADRTPDLAVLPPPALAELQGIPGERLQPVFSTEIQRTTWVLELGETRMELALDQGEIRAGEAVRTLSEIELELLSGPAQGLFDAALALLDAGLPLSIDPRSKAALGYQLAGATQARPVKARPLRLDPEEDAGAAWARLVEAALGQLADNLPGYLEQPEDIEYLHQIRVGLRRAMGLARLLETPPDWLPGLKTAMAVLNPARDWDVFLAETLPRLPAVEPEFLARAGEMAAAARLAAQAHLASPEFTRALLQAGRALLAPPDLERTAAVWAAQVLEQRWLGAQRRVRHLAGGDPEQRHRLRIALKKFRYASDALGGLYGKAAMKTQAHLEALQDGLGALNDLAVAQRLLRHLAAAHGETAFSAGRVLGWLESLPGHAETTARLRQSWAGIKPYWR